jgi:hypothetical protein
LPCSFKVICSLAELEAMNAPVSDPGAVGKAITVYPRQDVFAEVAEKLAGALIGLTGPRINSDRRVRPDAPVYYRYGPFVARYRLNESGEPELIMTGPSGQDVPGTATAAFVCPDWAADPFADRSTGADAERPEERLVGGRYRTEKGLQLTARGRLYRGVDTRTGRSVVIKEARAYIGGEDVLSDARSYLRNELRVLNRLAGLPG